MGVDTCITRLVDTLSLKLELNHIATHGRSPVRVSGFYDFQRKAISSCVGIIYSISLACIFMGVILVLPSLFVNFCI